MLGRTLSRLLCTLAILAASVAWIGWLFLHTAGDPTRSDRIAHAILDDPRARKRSPPISPRALQEPPTRRPPRPPARAGLQQPTILVSGDDPSLQKAVDEALGDPAHRRQPDRRHLGGARHRPRRQACSSRRHRHRHPRDRRALLPDQRGSGHGQGHPADDVGTDEAAQSPDSARTPAATPRQPVGRLAVTRCTVRLRAGLSCSANGRGCCEGRAAGHGRRG